MVLDCFVWVFSSIGDSQSPAQFSFFIINAKIKKINQELPSIQITQAFFFFDKGQNYGTFVLYVSIVTFISKLKKKGKAVMKSNQNLDQQRLPKIFLHKGKNYGALSIVPLISKLKKKESFVMKSNQTYYFLWFSYARKLPI